MLTDRQVLREAYLGVYRSRLGGYVCLNLHEVYRSQRPLGPWCAADQAQADRLCYEFREHTIRRLQLDFGVDHYIEEDWSMDDLWYEYGKGKYRSAWHMRLEYLESFIVSEGGTVPVVE